MIGRIVSAGLLGISLGSATVPVVMAEPRAAMAPVEPRLGYDLSGLPWTEELSQPPAPPPPPDRGVRILVSLGQQKAWVFDDGKLVDTSPVSTGKRGHSTPVGTFPILQKKVHHRSNKYSNAPMPYMQRLTWTGIALHAGALPGYPASHGCIRFPRAFAKKLYGLTDFGTKVTVTSAKPSTADAAFALIGGEPTQSRDDVALAAR